MPTVLKYLFNLLYRLLFGTMKKKNPTQMQILKENNKQ